MMTFYDFFASIKASDNIKDKLREPQPREGNASLGVAQ